MGINIPVQLHGIPEELREHRRFVPWEQQERRKVPLGRDGNPGDANDPRNWRRLQDAIPPMYQVPPKANGIGFALKGSGFTVIDFDWVIDTAGRLDPVAARFVEMFDSFTELSPSGRGLHTILKVTLPGGNRNVPGIDVLGTTGYVTLTGTPWHNAPIRSGGEAWQQFLDSLPPHPEVSRINFAGTLSIPAQSDCDAILMRLFENPRARGLWEGNWTGLGYISRSEADAGLARDLARNGANLAQIVYLLAKSAMPRARRRNERYFMRQALFALSGVEVRVGQWSGVEVPNPSLVEENRRRAEAVERLRCHPRVWREADFLVRIAAEIASRLARGLSPEAGGFWRTSLQTLSGDHPSRPGLPEPRRLMSRQAARKALRRLEALGVLDLLLRPAHTTWTNGSHLRSHWNSVTHIRVEGSNFVEILEGFMRRADAHAPSSAARVLTSRDPVGSPTCLSG